MNFINETCLNFQSAYSRSRSQSKKTDPGTWSYTIQPEFFPNFPADTLRVMSINLQRFPHTFYSLDVIASVILSAKPHIVLLQEISRQSAIPELISIIESFSTDRIYKKKINKLTVRNLQLCILWDTETFDLDSFQTLFHTYEPPYLDFIRPVVNINLISDWFDVGVNNLHLPSNRTIGSLAKREICFAKLENHFPFMSQNQLVILGGDWNTGYRSSFYSDYLSLFRSQYKNYYWRSDVILNNLGCENHIIKSNPKQFVWDYININKINASDWLSYVSDHFPIVTDYVII